MGEPVRYGCLAPMAPPINNPLPPPTTADQHPAAGTHADFREVLAVMVAP
jgi:hypothetical protein